MSELRVCGLGNTLQMERFGECISLRSQAPEQSTFPIDSLQVVICVGNLEWIYGVIHFPD